MAKYDSAHLLSQHLRGGGRRVKSSKPASAAHQVQNQAGLHDPVSQTKQNITLTGEPGV